MVQNDNETIKDVIVTDAKNKKYLILIGKISEKVKNVSYNDLVVYLYQPTDPASLGVIRFLFGKYTCQFFYL